MDEEKRGVASSSSEDDLATLLSAAIRGSAAPELPQQSGADGPPADPSQIPDGDFRSIAAGLIAELESSLKPDAPHEAGAQEE